MKYWTGVRVKTALAIAVVIAGAALFWDPASSVSGQYSGAIVAIYPLGKLPGTGGEVLVRLSTGKSVMAKMQFNRGAPAIGTPVTVTVFDSFLLQRRSYTAQIEPSPSGL
jgi:fucose permease